MMRGSTVTMKTLVEDLTRRSLHRMTRTTKRRTVPCLAACGYATAPRQDGQSTLVSTAAASLTQPPPVTHNMHGMRYRSFSTAPEPARTPSISLRNIVKPFMLKCHPDVQRSDSAREINLTAIQNLNSFLDTLQTMSTGKAMRLPDDRIVEIDFVLQLEDDGSSSQLGLKKRKKATAAGFYNSRRKVELLLPPPHLSDDASWNARSRAKVERHGMQQVVKLLKVAGLSIPSASLANENNEQADALRDAWEQDLGMSEDENDNGVAPSENSRPHFDYRRPPKSNYERSRERFASNINWKRYDQLYQQAVVDMNADLATEGLIRNNRKLRTKLIATIVSNVRVKDESIDVLEQLTAARRLSLLLESHFDDLHLEDFGNMWENLVLILTPSREYSTSGSARHRRQGHAAEDGFAFTLHPDYSVTIHVPIDFRDDELVQELDRNLWDFYNLVGDGLEGLYPEY